MSTASMHFGPEWMRTKSQNQSRSQPPPSPPPTSAPAASPSTYSALLSSAPIAQFGKHDEAYPFRYSKEELLRIYKEGGGRGGLGLEVEKWEGVVRELGSEPISLREMGEAEKKLFATPLNSDLRRRQSTDYLSLPTQSPGAERTRFNPNGPTSGTNSPLRERFGQLRRRDGSDQPTVTIPRKPSISTLQGPLISPREALPSPRTRVGYGTNFDGVLNNADSWVARRRASEASLKSGVGTSKETSSDGRAAEIREEVEDGENEDSPEKRMEKPNPVQSQPPPEPAPSQQNATASQDIAHDVDLSSLTRNKPSIPENGVPAAAPPGIPDLASIEWLYKDPSGQVQGPFRADLMQKWFDDGYFTPDLPMKRLHLDAHWSTVEELLYRSTGGKLFLSPLAPSMPPGLAHRTDSPLSTYSFPSDLHLHSGPYQPAPLRNLRSSTLDSFGSNASDSPSSSFGAGRFGNGSPDPNAFGGRGSFFAGDGSGSRVGSISSIPDPVTGYSRLQTYSEGSADPSLASRTAFGAMGPSRGSSADSYSYARAYSPGQNTWNAVPNTTAASYDAMALGRGSNDAYGLGGSPAFGDVNTYRTAEYSQHSGLGLHQGQAQQFHPESQFPGSQPLHHQASNNHVSYSHLSNTVTHINTTQSSWPTTDLNQPNNYDLPPPASTTVTAQGPASLSEPVTNWGQPLNPPVSTSQISPWAVASQGLTEANWKEPEAVDVAPGATEEPVSPLTRPLVIPPQLAPPAPKPARPLADVPASPAEATKLPPPPPGKSKTKSTQPIEHPPPPVQKQTSPPPTSDTIVAAPQPSAPKPAWSKDDDGKGLKVPSASVSLREIQQAEAKRADARKVAEREKERAVRATAAASASDAKDDVQMFTATWGLPTSQVGSRASAVPKEIVAPTQPAAAVPSHAVWTAAAKAPVAKKTMKEIQEEEERRKKLAAKETVASAARRAYAETTTKIVASVQSQNNNPWTTVGPGGKPAAAAVAASLRPVATVPAVTNGASSAPRVNGATPVRTSPATSPPKPAPASAKVDEIISPSHEFLKWLSDSLKGLNSSVNVEEIMSMLLSFPLDPDASTVELISELIYANSTTLDGRRFASEYINKRKADAATHKGAAAAGKPSTKPVSIADVVKAAPKPAQSEWGFKVVNKKKKGNRA